MNCIIVFATIACVLSAALASSNNSHHHHKADKAHSEVMSYVAENMGGVRMMRSNRDHLDCYNGFLPLINSLAIWAKDQSHACVNNASDEKDQALAKLDRKQIAAEVKRITDSLEDCSSKDGLDYFICLESNAEANRQILETIKNMAAKVVAESTSAVAHIQGNEDECIMHAVDSAKNKSDAAFDKLKSCIRGQASFDEDSSTASPDY